MGQQLRKAAFAALGFGIVGTLAVAEVSYHGYQTPPYAVERTVGAAEMRAYAPHILAEVTVRGSRDGALRQGFRVLAGYIFGGNSTADSVAMTVPVAQRPSETVAMTAPVAQTGDGETWTVTFMMPREYTTETLPVPNDPAVRFVTVPPHRELVLQFSGRGTTDRLEENAAELREIAAAAGLRLAGGPSYYFYDDPMTLPWNRRNEVAYRLE